MMLAAEIAVAVLAVFGLYAILRWIVSAFFVPPDLLTALEIRHLPDEEQTALLLQAAHENFFAGRSGRTVALIDTTLIGYAELRERLEAAGVACFYVDLND